MKGLFFFDCLFGPAMGWQLVQGVALLSPYAGMIRWDRLQLVKWKYCTRLVQFLDFIPDIMIQKYLQNLKIWRI